MLTQVFELLAVIRERIAKPNARISVEEYNLIEPGDSLRFQFKWYESKIYTLTWIVPRIDVEQIRGEEDIIVDQIITGVNKALVAMLEKGESQ